MKFNRMSNILFFLLIFLLIIIFRFPNQYGPHALGSDTFENQITINNLIVENHPDWIYNPLSYFGLTQPSQPSGSYLFSAQFLLITNINFDIYVYLLGVIMAIIAAYSSFLLGNLIKNRQFGFILAILFSTSSPFVLLTYSEFTTRVFFVTFIPFLLVFSIKMVRKDLKFSKSNKIIFFLIVFSLFMAHRMYFLLILFFISIIISKYIYYTYAIYFFKSNRFSGISIIFILLYFFLLFLLFFIQFLNFGIYSKSNVLSNLQIGALFNNASSINIILNLGTNYIGNIGLIIFFIIVGIFSKLKEHLKSIFDIILLITILLFIPILVLNFYVSLFVTIFYIIISLFGITHVLNAFHFNLSKRQYRIKMKQIRAIMLIIILTICILFNYYMVQRRTNLNIDGINNKNWISTNNYDAGIYIQNNLDGKIIGNSMVAVRSAAISKNHVFAPSTEFNLLNNGDMDQSDLYLINIEDLSFNSDYIWVKHIRSAAWDFSYNYVGYLPNNELFLTRCENFNIKLVVVDLKNENGVLDSSNNPVKVIFYTFLSEYQYLIYSNSEIKIYII